MLRRHFLTAAAGACAASAAVPPRPNVVLILMDDMAQRALSCYGNPYVQTPNIDRLAREGMKFTQAYVTPQCTPTRATILTGQYTARNKMWHVIPPYGYPHARVAEPTYRHNLSRDTFTLAKGFQSAGYATGIFGKWHLTVNRDGNYHSLTPAGAPHYGFDATLTPTNDRNELGRNGDKAVNRITDEAVAFIERNRARPFFCYVPHHSIHGVVAAPNDIVRKYLDAGRPAEGTHNATYLAAIEHMDAGIGRLLRRLDELNLTERTAVFFLTDNGGVAEKWDVVQPADAPTRIVRGIPEFENPPLRAGKGSCYEGGIRVPMLVRWPGVVPAGKVCDTPVHGVDLLPTMLPMAGAKVPSTHKVDGVNLLPVLRTGSSKGSRALYGYMPFYDVRWAHTPSAILREGDFKLIEFFGDYLDANRGGEYVVGERLELYNLRDDVSEQQNLASANPQRVKQMRAKLHAWIRSCGEQLPALNPNFDPKRALAESRLA